MSNLIPEKEWLEELELTPDELKSKEDKDQVKKEDLFFQQSAERPKMGRPKKRMGKTKRLTVDIPAELHKQLKQVALDRDQSLTDLITAAVAGIIKVHQNVQN